MRYMLSGIYASVPGGLSTLYGLQDGGSTFRKQWASLNDALLVLSGGPVNHQFCFEISPSLLCSQVLSFALLILGFMIPSMVIYNIELASRTAYAERMYGRRLAWDRGGGEVTNWAQNIVLMLIGVSSVWSILLYMISASQYISWG